MPSEQDYRQLLRENRERCDDESPIGHVELELIRRDTIQAERKRSMKPRNFAGDYR
jgi:hypothetical protein